MTFDNQPTLVGAGVTLKPLTAEDRPGLHAAASDPRTWEQHPTSKRHTPEVFHPYFDFLLGAGGTLAVWEGDRIIGCSRYYPVPDQPTDIGIGFTFLAPSHWGGSYNFEIKELMITHAFQSFDRIWFHIGSNNLRSQIATTRLGAEWRYDAELDLGTGPSLTKCYVMTPESWTAAADTLRG
ncbi:MAG: GNAT family N-acetyltransferase [Pseudomonadota bacterium]